MSDGGEVIRLPGGTPVGTISRSDAAEDSQPRPPDVRVWLSATGGPDAAFEPSTFHDSRSCADRGGGAPIPSFTGFCIDLEPCGTCVAAFERDTS